MGRTPQAQQHWLPSGYQLKRSSSFILREAVAACYFGTSYLCWHGRGSIVIRNPEGTYDKKYQWQSTSPEENKLDQALIPAPRQGSRWSLEPMPQGDAKKPFRAPFSGRDDQSSWALPRNSNENADNTIYNRMAVPSPISFLLPSPMISHVPTHVTSFINQGSLSLSAALSTFPTGAKPFTSFPFARLQSPGLEWLCWQTAATSNTPVSLPASAVRYGCTQHLMGHAPFSAQKAASQFPLCLALVFWAWFILADLGHTQRKKNTYISNWNETTEMSHFGSVAMNLQDHCDPRLCCLLPRTAALFAPPHLGLSEAATINLNFAKQCNDNK